MEQPLGLVRTFDAWQQRNPIVGPGVAVFCKFRDDDGNALAVALAWYGFVSTTGAHAHLCHSSWHIGWGDLDHL